MIKLYLSRYCRFSFPTVFSVDFVLLYMILNVVMEQREFAEKFKRHNAYCTVMVNLFI